MRYLLFFFLFIYRVYALLILVFFVLILFPCIVVLLITKNPFRGNAVYKLSSWAVQLAFFLIGIRHEIIFESDSERERSMIYVFNHISYLDALVLVLSLKQTHFRGLGKQEIANIPIFGLIYKTAVITVKRDSREDRARSVDDLKKNLAANISVALSPEGTFNTTGAPLLPFYDGAFKIAIQTQTPIQPLLFLGTNDVLNYRHIFTLRPGKTTTVFLQPTEVHGFSINEMESLKKNIFVQMEEKLKFYKASWIQSTHEARI